MKGYYSNGEVQILGSSPISKGTSVIITFIEDNPFPQMNEEVFWDLIAHLNWKENLSNEEIVAPLVAMLHLMSESDIYLFQEILSEKLYLLDTKSHAENIGEDSYKENEFFSSDLFLYARACVVANGKECFEEVLKSPDKMPKDVDFEPLLYVAREAYFLKTNQTDFSTLTKYCYETFSNKEGWNLSRSILEIAKS
ncbi:MAG: DUF4240 domain-containing protein [Leptospiraceae bacterium]|nr:DUF4240 domain-containing protein [Leptospiraceae bacterium]